jgi:archaellum component FlaF (FlaF/FlaG flagellin family)
VYFTPDGSSAEYGGTATIEVYADTTDEFQGGQFYLDFGESCANITDLTFDSTWIYTSKNFADYSGAVFASFRKDPPMVNGLQHICTLTIQCDNPDYCMTDLHFAFAGEAPSGKDTKLFDDGGNVLADQEWHDGTFTCMNLPDLVITGVYGEQQTGDDYIVHYTVSNEGNAEAQSGHISTLYLDGMSVEDKEVTDALAPGESYSGTFDTVLTMTMPNDLMMVCCDTNSDEMELDETNNCIESFYPAGIEIKVDVQDGGECFDMGEQFLVNVDVDPRNIPVYGVQYTLSFNNSALHGEWQNEGTFLNSDGATTTVVINTIDNGAGTISFAATRTDIQTGVTDLLLEAGGIKAYGVDDGEFYYFIIVVMMYTASLGVGSSSMHRTRN